MLIRERMESCIVQSLWSDKSAQETSRNSSIHAAQYHNTLQHNFINHPSQQQHKIITHHTKYNNYNTQQQRKQDLQYTRYVTNDGMAEEQISTSYSSPSYLERNIQNSVTTTEQDLRGYYQTNQTHYVHHDDDSYYYDYLYGQGQSSPLQDLDSQNEEHYIHRCPFTNCSHDTATPTNTPTHNNSKPATQTHSKSAMNKHSNTEPFTNPAPHTNTLDARLTQRYAPGANISANTSSSTKVIESLGQIKHASTHLTNNSIYNDSNAIELQKSMSLINITEPNKYNEIDKTNLDIEDEEQLEQSITNTRGNYIERSICYNKEANNKSLAETQLTQSVTATSATPIVALTPVQQYSDYSPASDLSKEKITCEAGPIDTGPLRSHSHDTSRSWTKREIRNGDLPVTLAYRRKAIQFIAHYLSGADTAGAASGLRLSTNTVAVQRLYRTVNRLEGRVYAATTNKEAYMKSLAIKLTAVTEELNKLQPKLQH